MVWAAIILAQDKILEAFAESPVFYCFVSFPFIGAWILIYAIQETWGWYKFKQTPITLDPFPAYVGGHVSGALMLPIAGEKSGTASFNLVCLRRQYHRRQKNSRWDETPHWQDSITVQPDNMGNQVRLRFLFKPPADLPATTPKSDDYHVWRLRVHLPLAGKDFERDFELPIGNNNGEQVLESRYTVDTSYILASEDEGGVPTIRQTAAGTAFYYGYGRSKGMAIGLMISGIMIGTFGVFIFHDFTGFLPVTMGLMAVYVGAAAVALFAVGIFIMGNSLSVTVGLKGIHKQHKILGFTHTEQIAADDIIDLQVDNSGTMTTGNKSTIWYKITAKMQDGSTTRVGDDLVGHSHAGAIRQQMLDALGMRWQPAAALSAAEQMTSPKNKIPKWLRMIVKLLSYSFWIAILIDIIRRVPFITDFIIKVLP